MTDRRRHDQPVERVRMHGVQDSGVHGHLAVERHRYDAGRAERVTHPLMNRWTHPHGLLTWSPSALRLDADECRLIDRDRRNQEPLFARRTVESPLMRAHSRVARSKPDPRVRIEQEGGQGIAPGDHDSSA